MINDHNNNDSASSFKNHDLDLDDFNEHYDQAPSPGVKTIPRNSIRQEKQPHFNPFNQKPRESFTFKEDFRFSSQSINNRQSQKPIQQPNPFSRNSLPKDSYKFNIKPNETDQKQSEEFMFKGDISGSLFSSKKSQKEQQKVHKSKNLQNFRSLLKQYYNENYLVQRLQIQRKSNILKKKGSIRRSDIPYFITREPILFQKKFYGFRSGYDLSGNFLCKLIGNRIYYKNVLNEQLQFVQEVKCEYIELAQNQSASPSLQIDDSSLHLFYYSNTTKEIVVLSLSKNRKTNNEICRIKTRAQRINPLLYLIEINKQKILLLIGGYHEIHLTKRPDEVIGSKYIEIFLIDKWGTSIMQSRIIKLINGKISPLIIFPVKIQLNDSILLIGGNTMGKKVGKSLSFKDYKVVNRSSNVRGMYISSKNIIECIEQNKDIMNLPNGNNISVQIEDKVSLYNGYVDYVKSNQREKIRLFLPKMTQFYTLKILKKQVRIIKSKQIQQRLLTFDSNDSYHHLEMKSFRKPTLKYYEITSKGIFQQKSIRLANTSAFGITNQWKCPCQIM